MLNKPLYDALVKVVGDVEIVNEGDPGTYQIGMIPSGFAKGKQSQITATMVNWGETYRFRDIVCRDHKYRAFVCHRMGTSIPLKPTDPTGKRAYFSKHLAVCHHNQCQKTPEFKKFIRDLPLPLNYVTTAIQNTTVPEQVNKRKFIIHNVQLPLPSFTLTDDRTPSHAQQYLEARGFDLTSLERDFDIRYSPKNAVYTVDNVEKYLFDERIIIPIQQHVHVISWQGRAIGAGIDPKYFNLPKGNKRTWVYNFDKALMYPEVVIFEGVTNVWRTGADAVALFGSAISMEQLELIKTVWAYDGNGVLCLDEDKWCNNQNTDLKYAQRLIQEKAFANGVAVLRLRNGDAAQHTHERMRQLKRLAHMKASKDPQCINILDEADVHDDPSPDEQEPRESTIPEDQLKELLKDPNTSDIVCDYSECVYDDSDA